MINAPHYIFLIFVKKMTKKNKDMGSLKLILKAVWFHMIADGIKHEEYREIRWYYLRRLIEPNETTPYYLRSLLDVKNEDEFSELIIKHPHYLEFLKRDLQRYADGGKSIFNYKHNYVTFYNGYHSGRDEMFCEIESITIGEGNPDWGAEPGHEYFVIKLKK